MTPPPDASRDGLVARPSVQEELEYLRGRLHDREQELAALVPTLEAQKQFHPATTPTCGFDYQRVFDWAMDPKRQRADIAFTEGIERHVANLIEDVMMNVSAATPAQEEKQVGNHEFCEACGESDFHRERPCDSEKVKAMRALKQDMSKGDGVSAPVDILGAVDVCREQLSTCSCSGVTTNDFCLVCVLANDVLAALASPRVSACAPPVQLSDLLVDIAQVFDGWHQDGTAWTEHDESVRQRVSEAIRKVALAMRDQAYALAGHGERPATPAGMYTHYLSTRELRDRRFVQSVCDAAAHDFEKCTGELADVLMIRGLSKLSQADPPAPPAAPRGQWLPIAEYDRAVSPEALFWLVPKSADESYTDTSGKPIVASFKSYMVHGRYGCWSALTKATHFYPLPAAPAPASPEEK